MGADRVLYRPILRCGVVIGYLWCTGGTAGFFPRTADGEDERVRRFWMGWLDAAREEGLSPWDAMSSWDPRTEFPYGEPAPGGPNELAGEDDLQALLEGRAPSVEYADDSRVPVRHYQVIRDGAYLGRLWASVDEAAAGFLPSADLGADDPAPETWRRRLADSLASGLTPAQAVHALRDLPDDGVSGHVTDPLGQGYLRDLRG